MELVRASDGKKFEGPGYICQGKARDFEIKIYSAAKINVRDVFQGWVSNNAGVLLGEADFFTLSAIDDSHRSWRAERIINPGTIGHAGRDGTVVTADCQEVTLIEQRAIKETNNWVTFVAIEAFKFPRTTSTETTLKVGESRQESESRRNAAEITSNDLLFCFEEDNGVTVNVSAKEKPLHPHLEARVTEAITFALGTIPAWSMVRRSEGKETVARFRSFETRARKKPQWPPYRIELVDGTGSVWRMFDLHLAHVLLDTESETHPLSLNIFGIAQTHDSSVEGQALAIAVAVESILALFFKAVGAPDTKLIADVDRLFEYLGKWDGDEKLIERAKGSLGGLKQARPDDRLRDLVASGVVGEEERQAWKKLRNTAAHGDWHKYDGKLQELLDLTGKVTGLFNQLIFHVIGYRGRQTDYGTHGWPTNDYPPVKGDKLIPTEMTVQNEGD